MATCARDGCTRQARGDDYCSTYCCKRSNGTLGYEPNDETKKARRRVRALAKKHGGWTVEVANTDAMTKVVPGSYGTGKRQ